MGKKSERQRQSEDCAGMQSGCERIIAEQKNSGMRRKIEKNVEGHVISLVLFC